MQFWNWASEYKPYPVLHRHQDNSNFIDWIIEMDLDISDKIRHKSISRLLLPALLKSFPASFSECFFFFYLLDWLIWTPKKKYISKCNFTLWFPILKAKKKCREQQSHIHVKWVRIKIVSFKTVFKRFGLVKSNRIFCHS